MYKITNKKKFTAFILTLAVIILFAIGFITEEVSTEPQINKSPPYRVLKKVIRVYVHTDDTIWTIASDYGDSSIEFTERVQNICAYNNITTSTFKTCSYINIPFYN